MDIKDENTKEDSILIDSDTYANDMKQGVEPQTGPEPELPPEPCLSSKSSSHDIAVSDKLSQNDSDDSDVNEVSIVNVDDIPSSDESCSSVEGIGGQSISYSYDIQLAERSNLDSSSDSSDSCDTDAEGVTDDCTMQPIAETAVEATECQEQLTDTIQTGTEHGLTEESSVTELSSDNAIVSEAKEDDDDDCESEKKESLDDAVVSASESPAIVAEENQSTVEVQDSNTMRLQEVNCDSCIPSVTEESLDVCSKTDSSSSVTPSDTIVHVSSIQNGAEDQVHKSSSSDSDSSSGDNDDNIVEDKSSSDEVVETPVEIQVIPEQQTISEEASEIAETPPVSEKEQSTNTVVSTADSEVKPTTPLPQSDNSSMANPEISTSSPEKSSDKEITEPTTPDDKTKPSDDRKNSTAR